MTTAQALLELAKGNSVRGTEWNDDEYIRLDGDEIVDEEGNVYTFSLTGSWEAIDTNLLRILDTWQKVVYYRW